MRNLPSALAFGVCFVLSVAFSEFFITDGAAVAVSAALMLLATVLSARFAALESRTRWHIVVPGIALAALALLRLGTGGMVSPFTAVLILPVIWIAAEAGRRWVAVAAFATFIALCLPYAAGAALPDTAREWLHLWVVPLVFALGAAVVNDLSRRGRASTASVQLLAEELRISLSAATTAADHLRSNEERLRTADELTSSVLDAVTEQSVIGTGLTGLIDVWNPGAAVMLGLAAHEVEGRRFVFEFHEQQELQERSRELNYPPGETVLNPGFSALVESARLGSAEVRDWTYVRDDGTRLSVRVAVTPRVDDSGATIGYIFVGTDVTRDLEVARLKDEFVGLISHELRTPLSSILGYLELMRDDDIAPLSDEQLEFLSVAERNANRLLRLVGDLLFTAQVESGQLPLDTRRLELSTIVQERITSARPAAHSAGVTLVGDLPLTSVFVNGEPLRLGQAIDNLVSNALKFTPRGGTVTITLGTDGDEAIVRVADTGMGIPADELDQLYSRFFRASTATRNAVQGVGLGLSITRAIVTAHDGTMDVESTEGVGTAFTMFLPLLDGGSAVAVGAATGHDSRDS